MAIFTKPNGRRLYYMPKVWINDIKIAWQRARMGYAYIDVWEIDTWFLDIMPKMLTHLKDYGMSYPGFHEDGTEFSPEEWSKVISEMIECFEKAKEQDDDCGKGAEYLIQTFTIRDAYKNKGLEMFKEHFWNLWD